MRLLTAVSLVQVQQGELMKPVNLMFTGFLHAKRDDIRFRDGQAVDALLKGAADEIKDKTGDCIFGGDASHCFIYNCGNAYICV